jgi:hypothetical protein
MKDEDSPLFDLSNLSEASFKKIPEKRKCHATDFQPLLKYSSWDLFCPIFTKMVRGCKRSIHSFDSHLKESHAFRAVNALEQKEVYLLSRQIVNKIPALALDWKEHSVEKMQQRHPTLQTVLTSRRRYSSLPKELKHATCLVCIRLSEEDSGKGL